MNIEKALHKNNFLRTDKESEELLKSEKFQLLVDYGEDKNLIIYTPHISMFETAIIKK